MQDHPSAAAILEMVLTHLREQVGPKLEGRDRFELRVALNALGLVRRTLELAPASDAAEQARLEALLGETGNLETLNRLLCARIREGALDLSSPDLSAHLRATALEKLAVDQPTYSAYRRAVES